MTNRLSNLQAAIRKRCLSLRAMDRLVHSTRFQEAFKIDPNFDVLTADIEAIESWIDSTLKTKLDISELSLRDLRARASKLGLLFVTKYTKDELIVWISNYDRRSQKDA